MNRLLLVAAICLLGCSLVDRTPGRTPPPGQGYVEPDRNPTGEGSAPLWTEEGAAPTAEPTEGQEAETYSVAPFCTILDQEDTEYVDFGYSIEINWGWEAMTEEQTADYVENAIIRVTFDGREITDAEQGPIFERDGTYHVFWWKTLGVLARGTYEMTFFEEFRTKIFDGWDYYGPGTANATIEDTCYLVIQ